MIKSVVFDFDGLICDTETPELEAWKSIFDEHELPFPVDDYLQTIGSIYNDLSPLVHLEKMTGNQVDINGILSEFKSRKKRFIELEPLMPCVQNYLDHAKSIGLKIGLASSSPIEWIDYHLDRLHIADFFDCITTASDVQKTKPDPELYEKTVKLLNNSPDEVLALEDAPNGVTAARQAGIFVVAVPNPVTARFNFDNAHIVISSLCEITLDDLIERIKNH